jgi:hypothetical protein
MPELLIVWPAAELEPTPYELSLCSPATAAVDGCAGEEQHQPPFQGERKFDHVAGRIWQT